MTAVDSCNACMNSVKQGGNKALLKLFLICNKVSLKNFATFLSRKMRQKALVAFYNIFIFLLLRRSIDNFHDIIVAQSVKAPGKKKVLDQMTQKATVLLCVPVHFTYTAQ